MAIGLVGSEGNAQGDTAPILAPASITEPASIAAPASNWPVIALVIGLAIIAVVAATRAMRLNGAQQSAWRYGSSHSFILFVGLLLVAPSGGRLFGEILGVAADDPSLRGVVIHALGSFATQLLMCLPILFLGQTAIACASQSSPLSPWSCWRAAGLGVIAMGIAWFPLQAIGSIAGSIQLYYGGAQPPVEGHSTFELLRTSPDLLLTSAMVVVVLFCAPVAEEFCFRGALQRGLRGLPLRPWFAILITSAVFAAIHIEALTAGGVASGLVTLVALAVMLGWLMERTGRIIAPIVAHALFNLINLILFWCA